MRRNQSIIYVLVAIVICMFCFQQCKNPARGLISIGSEDSVRVHIISIDSAAKLTANFRHPSLDNRQNQNQKAFDSSFPYAESFNRDAISAALNAPGAEGLRVYLGKDGNGLIRFVLIPVDKQGNDIVTQLTEDKRTAQIHIPGINSANAAPPSAKGQALENGQRCPDNCPKGSALYQ